MVEPTFCGYVGCYCLLPSQVENACFDCVYKESKSLCPNGLGLCSEKDCSSCPEFLYAIVRSDIDG